MAGRKDQKERRANEDCGYHSLPVDRTPIVLILPIVVILDVDIVLWHYYVVVSVDAQVVGVATCGNAYSSITLLPQRWILQGIEPTHSIYETLSFPFSPVLCIFIKVFGHFGRHLECHL